MVLGSAPGDCGIPVFADPRCGVVGPSVVQHADALVRCVDLTPEVVVHVGPAPASRVVNEWVAASGAVEVVAASRWHDPSHTAAQLADVVDLGAPDPEWMARWSAASDAAERAVADVLDVASSMSEPFVARTLLRTLRSGAELVVASSMPTRDLEWYGVPRSDVRVHANRGANGIDGTIATAIGVAVASSHSTAVLLGDIAFLHDSTALIGVNARDIDLMIVVIDNDGGGIFSFLPQAAAVDATAFEDLFGTPHGVDLGALAKAHGIPTTFVEDPADFAHIVGSGGGGVRLVAVRTDRTENVKVHQQLNEAVADAVRSLW